VYHLGTHVLVIEVDEGQHKGYLCTAYGDTKEGRMKGEKIRMYQIGQCFDGLPVLFLRYNPDAYKGEAIKDRRGVLVRWVKSCLSYQEWMVGYQVKYLFYDGYRATDDAWQAIKTEEVV
jgi:hypothetical protein